MAANMKKSPGYKKIIQYKVKADRAEENIGYIQSLFSTIERDQPDKLRFVVFQLEDGLSFVHIAFIETDDSNPLHEFEEFKKFAENITDRCEEPPEFSMLFMVGEYRLFN